MNKEKFNFYKEYPKTCNPKDFWGQVKRTINGVPVSKEQIDLIVCAVVKGLSLSRQDILLDLCCGNGALSALVFKHCGGGVGVDFSEFLISVARKHFMNEPHVTYVLRDVVEFCENPIKPNIFSKMLCYGSFSYLEYERAEKLLCLLRDNFHNLKKIYIGNCPDKDLLLNFTKNHSFEPDAENDPESPIGIWRTQEEFSSLASRCGWKISFYKMPHNFYASHYRYDVILTNED
jgi:SAM-dependent methyltransferase